MSTANGTATSEQTAPTAAVLSAPLRKRVKAGAAAAVARARAERLSDEDLAELAGLRQGIQQIRAMLEQGQKALAESVAIHDYELGKILRRYAVDPAAGDQLMEDGAIRRAPQPADAG